MAMIPIQAMHKQHQSGRRCLINASHVAAAAVLSFRMEGPREASSKVYDTSGSCHTLAAVGDIQAAFIWESVGLLLMLAAMVWQGCAQSWISWTGARMQQPS